MPQTLKTASRGSADIDQARPGLDRRSGRREAHAASGLTSQPFPVVAASDVKAAAEAAAVVGLAVRVGGLARLGLAGPAALWFAVVAEVLGYETRLLHQGVL